MVYLVMDDSKFSPDFHLIEADDPDKAALKFESLSPYYMGHVALVAEVKVRNGQDAVTK